MSRVAVVTGSNRGIGLAVVKLLATQNPEWVVYMTARDLAQGQEAARTLGLANVKVHQLDICDSASIAKFAEHLKATHGGIDVLVNNAGILLGFPSTDLSSTSMPYAEQAEKSMATNFFGTIDVVHALVVMMRPGGRIVHVASRSASMSWHQLSEDMKKKLGDAAAPGEILRWAKAFVDHSKAGDNEKEGYGNLPYGASKLAIVMITPLQQKYMDEKGLDMVVNSCCPNFVDTDMTKGFEGKGFPAEVGADVVVYLATLPNGTDVKGKFVVERQVVDVSVQWTIDKTKGLVRA